MKIMIFILGSEGTMGHFNGAYVLAKELLEKSKKNSVTIVSDYDFRRLISDNEIRFVKVSTKKLIGGRIGFMINGGHGPYLNAAIKKTRPDIAIFETFYPADFASLKFPDITRKILLVKTNIRNNLKYFLNSSGEKFFDQILVLDDVDGENRKLVKTANDFLKERKFFSFGPIIKSLDSLNIEKIRKRYSISDNEYNVLVSMGGGGYKADDGKMESEHLTEMLIKAHKILRSDIKNIKFIILSGYFSKKHPSGKNIIINKHENNFMELLSLANLIISQGGVNTVNEVRSIGAPAIFIPAKRSSDDQKRRVEKISKIGNYKWLGDISSQSLAREIKRFYLRHNSNKEGGTELGKTLPRGNWELADFLSRKI
jgi:UDP-N-acetylglucosamine:LPS N-acetylglucosamine transferase